MRPASSNPDRIAKLIGDLDNDQFATRQKAAEELEKLGELAEPALRKRSGGQVQLDLRRQIEEILDKVEKRIPSADQLRGLRAVQVLEQIGTAESCKVLATLGQGVPEARLTQEAKAALDRLGRQAATHP